jgi:hypothetical protein
MADPYNQTGQNSNIPPNSQQSQYTQQTVHEPSFFQDTTGIPFSATTDQYHYGQADTASTNAPRMACNRCGGSNILIHANVTEKSKARHGVIYWIFIGWWLHALMWIFLTLPMLIWRIIRPNRKTKSVITTTAVCQNCGNTWVIKQ